jgi:hypothetical protein
MWNDFRRMTAGEFSRAQVARVMIVSGEPAVVLMPVKLFQQYKALLQERFDDLCQAKKELAGVQGNATALPPAN